MHPLRVKICGVTPPADVAACAAAGADAVGINFHPGSNGTWTAKASQALLRSIPAAASPGSGCSSGCRSGRLPPWPINLACAASSTTASTQPPEDLFPFSLVAAFRVRDRQSLADIERLPVRVPDGRPPAGGDPARCLCRRAEGGTGRTAPWDLIADFRPGVPVILAGGLTPDNVAEAIRTVRPAGVDVASGVESAPGRKDPDQVRAFVANAQEAAAGL